jgi:hypothetical protein
MPSSENKRKFAVQCAPTPFVQYGSLPATHRANAGLVHINNMLRHPWREWLWPRFARFFTRLE